MVQLGGPPQLKSASELASAEFENEIVAVLLDLTMPGMDGEETLRRLREIRPGLPVLVMSGFSDAQIAERLFDEPGIATLRKPFTMRALTEAIRGLLESPAAAAGRTEL